MIEAALPPRPKTLLAAYLKGGLFGLLARTSDRTITQLDETGFSTAGGRRFAWGDIEMIDRTIYTLFGADGFQTVHLRTRQGAYLTLPLAKAGNARELLEYFLRHAPRL